MSLLKLLSPTQIKVGEVVVECDGPNAPLAALDFASQFVQLLDVADWDRLCAEKAALYAMGHVHIADAVGNGMLLWQQAVRLAAGKRAAA